MFLLFVWFLLFCFVCLLSLFSDLFGVFNNSYLEIIKSAILEQPSQVHGFISKLLLITSLRLHSSEQSGFGQVSFMQVYVSSKANIDIQIKTSL